MIRIKELYRLQNMDNLRLIAGREGIERTVNAAVLFEYDPSRIQQADFYRGDLVVTTLAYARSDRQLLTQSLLALMRQGIAGLMVKTAYFDDLPQEVLDVAEQMGTPILLFDRTYIEEVILAVTELIRGRRHFTGYERELNALMSEELTREQVCERMRRIDPVGFSEYRVYALLPCERLPGMDEKLYTQLSCKDALAHRFLFMEWKHMLLAICRLEQTTVHQDAFEEMDELLTAAGIAPTALTVGLSDEREDVGDIGAALCEAVYAARAARLAAKHTLRAQELGMYAYLFAMSENPFIRRRCRDMMRRVQGYDAQNHTNLEHTARVYVAERMEIASTAKALYQHPNTVRYRLSKLQHLLGMEDDPLFASMLGLTINLSRILEEETPEGV